MSLVCTFYCVNICIPVSTILSSFQISTDSFLLGDNGLYLKEWECFSGIIFPGWTRVCSTSVLWRFFSPLPAPFCAGTRQLWAGKCESHFRGWAPSAPCRSHWAPLFALTTLTSAQSTTPAARGWFRTHARSPDCCKIALFTVSMWFIFPSWNCDVWLTQLVLHYHPVYKLFFTVLLIYFITQQKVILTFS